MVMRAHTSAILNLVDAVPNVTVYDAAVPDNPAVPYVVVRCDGGQWSRSGLLWTSDTVAVDVYATSVGTSREQAQWVAEKVAGALLDARPTITGRASHPVESVTSQPAQVDTDVNPPLVYAVDVYRLTTIPA